MCALSIPYPSLLTIPKKYTSFMPSLQDMVTFPNGSGLINLPIVEARCRAGK
jgi:hypothetical protein